METTSMAEKKESDAREDGLNTVKRTNVISARTLVPMFDGQDRKAGHADVQGHAGGRSGRGEVGLDLEGLNYEGSDKNPQQRRWRQMTEAARLFCSCLKTMNGPAVRSFQWCDGLVKVFTNNVSATVMVV